MTIDDGYADFTSAWPIFRRYEIPVLVYLVTDFLDLQLWFWWNRILYAVSQTSCREMEIFLLPENTPLRLPLESGPQRRQAAGTLIEAAKTLPNSRRLAVCEELLERLRVKLPAELPVEWRPLSWDQVRRLRQDGAEFGAHTKTHPILSTVEDAGSLRLEITGSKQRIEAEIDAAVLHFSYPNGRMQDVDRRTVDTVRESGFETAVTTEAGLNFFPEPLLLQRFLVDPAEPSSYFAERVSGLHHIRRAREVPRLD
ncbi:MAG: polysaccharide deacetylase family protein [Candidatus Binataceae bacterium]